jgi:hypothetical protein
VLGLSLSDTPYAGPPVKVTESYADGIDVCGEGLFGGPCCPISMAHLVYCVVHCETGGAGSHVCSWTLGAMMCLGRYR